MWHLLKVVLFLLGFLNLRRDVEITLLHPLKYPEDEDGNYGLNAEPDVGTQFPAKFWAEYGVDGSQTSEIGEASIESDEHTS